MFLRETTQLRAIPGLVYPLGGPLAAGLKPGSILKKSAITPR